MLREYSDRIRSAPGFEYHEATVAQFCADADAMRRAIAKFQKKANPFYPAGAYWGVMLELDEGNLTRAADLLARIAPDVADDPYLVMLGQRLRSRSDSKVQTGD